MSSSNKRQSILPRAPLGPKAPVNFSSSITIADSALLAGHHTINISSESVVHPRARLDSSHGRVTIGRRCVVHERTNIGAAPSDPSPADSRDGVFIHDYATVEVGAVVEAGGTVVGEGTVVGVGCRVGKGAKIGKVSSFLGGSRLLFVFLMPSLFLHIPVFPSGGLQPPFLFCFHRVLRRRC